MESQSKQLAALLKAHKSKEAHNAYLRHAAACDMAKRRPGGCDKMMKRVGKCKGSHDDAKKHMYA
jgi:hypothetical protein